MTTGCRAGRRAPPERLGIPGEGEPGETGPQPQLVLFVREERGVEAVQGVNYLAPEYGHDEVQAVVCQQIGEAKHRLSGIVGRAGWPSRAPPR